MASCDTCGREIKNYGGHLGGVTCANRCGQEGRAGEVASIVWTAPYEDVRQSAEYECILTARRWTLKERRTGKILASYNYLYECYADAEKREAARKEWRSAE